MGKIQILRSISSGHIDVKVDFVWVHELCCGLIERAICLSEVKVSCVDVYTCPIGKFTDCLCLEFTHWLYLGASHLRIVLELLAESVTVYHVYRDIKVNVSHLFFFLVFYLVLFIYKWALIWQVVALTCIVVYVVVKLVWSKFCWTLNQLLGLFWKLTWWSVIFVRWWWFHRLHLEIFNFNLVVNRWKFCVPWHSFNLCFTSCILNGGLTCSKWLVHVAWCICLLHVSLLKLHLINNLAENFLNDFFHLFFVRVLNFFSQETTPGNISCGSV